MNEFLLVFGIALFASFLTYLGAPLAERFDVPHIVVSGALQFAAGIITALVAFSLMPYAVRHSTPRIMYVAGLSIYAFVTLSIWIAEVTIPQDGLLGRVLDPIDWLSETIFSVLILLTLYDGVSCLVAHAATQTSASFDLTIWSTCSSPLWVRRWLRSAWHWPRSLSRWADNIFVFRS